MAKLFEDEGIRYFVVRNAEHHYSLWPTFLAVPEGWQVVFGEASRPDCIRYAETARTDTMGGNRSPYVPRSCVSGH